MHHTTTARPGHTHRWVLLTLLCALALLGAAQLAPAALAAGNSGTFVGGPNTQVSGVPDYPADVPNDHTVSAMRISDSAGDLTPNTEYYVKVRFSPTETPAGSANRGFIWNAQTSTWVNSQDAWTGGAFPKVTSDASGNIVAGTTWYYVKFADTTKSGTYYMIVSLQPVLNGGQGTTLNGTIEPQVNVLDMGTHGAWVHNGVPQANAASRVEADAAGSTTSVLTLMRTEVTNVDRFGNGPSGSAGDFQLAVPTGVGFDVRVKSNIWPTGVTNTVLSTPDVDIALGASDMTPPSAPGSLAVTPGNGSAVLSWGAATDNVGVTAYSVFRWTDPPAGADYTSQPIDVHDTSGESTTWTDTSVTNGTVYHYMVRARDAATSVGPRSNTADALPQAPSSVNLVASAKTVVWGGSASVSGVVSSGAGVAGASVRIQSSIGGGAWTTVNTLTSGAHGSFSTAVSPTRATMYRAVFDTSVVYATSTSRGVTVTPMVKLGAVSAPSKVKKSKSFSVSGSLTPKMIAGSKTVKIKCYLKKNGKWTLKKTFTAKNFNNGSVSKYKVSIKLTTKGSWHLVAYSPKTSKYAATTANAKNIKVK